MGRDIGRNYTNGKSDDKLIGHIGFGHEVEVDAKSEKKVLITGAGSYIGESFISYASKRYQGLKIDTMDMIDGTWKNNDFSNYDIVYHVAGIAHADIGEVSDDIKEKYYEVNTDLAIEVCKKAKCEGVKVFIFMSSMIVYGDSAPCGKLKRITKSMVPHSKNFYGDSKLQADVAVREMADDTFKVLVLRPPMIYGRDSKGNYKTLSMLAKKIPIFPNVENERSMLFIDNLCEFLCQIMLIREIKNNAIVLIPQNSEWTKTSNMVKLIAEATDKKCVTIGFVSWGLKLAGRFPGKIALLVNKAFGNFSYAHELSIYPGIDYQLVSLNESIDKTESATDGNKIGNRKALMLASVASMIDLFNEDNICILQELGYEVDVIANFDKGSITSNERVNEFHDELIQKGVNVYNIPIPRSISKIKDIMRSYVQIKKIVNVNQYQVIHCHSPIGGVLCRLASSKARKKYGTKVIYTAHGFHFFNGANRKAWIVYYPIEKLCSKFTDLIITINQEDFTNAIKFKTCQVEYVPGIGVDTEKIQNAIVDREQKRKELGFDDKDFVFMSIGQISRRKNHEVMIRAIAKVTNEKVKCLIVGFGELEKELRELAKKLGIENRIVFAGYRGDIDEILHVVDAFAFPSLQEGLPVSLMEAMSIGLPVVCSKIRGNVDLIEDGKGGYLYEANDIDGFTEGINKIVNSRDINMGVNNIETMKKFDKKIVHKQMEQIYKKL